MIIPTWNLPPAKLKLSHNEVHLWRAWLIEPVSHIQDLSTFLSRDETERAMRFHFEKDRRKFIIGRARLRQILSFYLNIRPEQLQFSYGPQGKPALAEIHYHKRATLKFNLAHSHKLALYALAYKREIGIDVEYIRRLDDMEQMARRFFSTRENIAFQLLPPDQKPIGFFNCWTRKEAYLKACGDGLTRPLEQFDVTLKPGEAARLLDVRAAPKEIARWSLETLEPAPNYAAALAVEGNDWRARCWGLTPSLFGGN